MKIRFLNDVELEIVTAFDDPNDIVYVEDEIIKEGTEYDVDVDYNEDTSTVDIQFGDGSMCYGVPATLIDCIS